MPLPGWLARLNRRVTNPAARPVAGRLPLFGVVLHRGRGTGRIYRTPVNVFPNGDGFVIALTYGRDVDWVKNVIAAGGCGLVHRGRTVDLGDPKVLPLRDDTVAIHGWVRAILRTMGVDQALLGRPREVGRRGSCAGRSSVRSPPGRSYTVPGPADPTAGGTAFNALASASTFGHGDVPSRAAWRPGMSAR